MNSFSTTENPSLPDVDIEAVLREYGLDGIENSTTVIQNGDNAIRVHANNTLPNLHNMLEPPAIVTEVSGNFVDNIHTAEVVNHTSVSTDEIENSQEEQEIHSSVETLLNNSSVPTPVLESESPEEHTESPCVKTAEEATDLLPANPEFPNINDNTARFSGAVWYKAVTQSTIILAGLGGIGSFILFCLSRMQPKQIFLYDDDRVEFTNLGGQLFNTSMVGKYKVNAMTELAESFSTYYGVQAIPQKFTDTTPAGDIMICGFDNMDARKSFFTAWVNHLVNHPHPEKCLFIDGRLDLEEFQVFCLTGNNSFNIKKYDEEYLFPDWKAESVQCSVKQTTHCANMIGSVIVNLFTNFIANEISPLSRDLPFKTYYNSAMMYFKTES